MELFFQDPIYKNCQFEDGELYMGNKNLENFEQFPYELEDLLGAAVLCSVAKQSMESEKSLH